MNTESKNEVSLWAQPDATTQTRLAEVVAQIEAHYANPDTVVGVDVDDHDLTESEQDKLETERDNLLVSLWADSNGLLVGGLDYIRQHVPRGGELMLFPNMPEGGFDAGDTLQVALFHKVRGKRKLSQYVVCYQDPVTGHYVTITPHEATIRVQESEKPYRVYRPFRDDAGNLTYHLVREVVVYKYDVDGAPAYLNYLIAKADGKLYQLLSARDDFDEEEWEEMFSEIVLGDRRLPNFNDVPTGPEHAQWLQEFLSLLERFDVNTDSEVIHDAVEPMAQQLYALTSNVETFYNLEDVPFEEDTDEELEGIDRNTPAFEVSRF